MEGLESLPGAELVLPGIADLRAGRTETIEALLVSIAAPRLRWLGLEFPDPARPERELALYDLLKAQASGDAYSRYNSLLRRLIAFEQALEQQVFRKKRLAAQS